MSERHDSHVEDRIQACLDGELPPREEAEVRDHVKRCETCRAAWDEMEAIAALLSADSAEGPGRSLWPGVRDKLRAERSPRASVAFRIGASLAAAAGILLGLYMGSIEVNGDSLSAATDATVWSEYGSLLGTESGASLDDLFLSVIDEEGDAL